MTFVVVVVLNFQKFSMEFYYLLAIERFRYLQHVRLVLSVYVKAWIECIQPISRTFSQWPAGEVIFEMVLETTHLWTYE